jgi:Fur family ferric uptake transcriptional regulator
MESRIERLCIDRGLKMTGQRRVIARVLSDATDHPDVEELYRRAAALDSHISIATVYRTVRLLEENGILERRDFGGGRARYEPTEHGNHYHLIDVETGKVIEFQDAEHERLMQTIAARLGFDLVSLRLELFGRRAAGQVRGQASASEPAPAAAMPRAEPERATPRVAGSVGQQTGVGNQGGASNHGGTSDHTGVGDRGGIIQQTERGVTR